MALWSTTQSLFLIDSNGKIELKITLNPKSIIYFFLINSLKSSKYSNALTFRVLNLDYTFYIFGYINSIDYFFSNIYESSFAGVVFYNISGLC